MREEEMNGRLFYWMGAFAVLFGAGAKSYGCGGYPEPNMTLSIPTEVIGTERVWYARTGQQFSVFGSAYYYGQPSGNPNPSYDTDDPWPLYTRLPDWACGIKKWEWDFYGDESPDYWEDYINPPAGDGYMDGSTVHCYGYPTLYDLKLRVTDDDAYEYLWPDKTSLGWKTCRVLALDLDISINGTNKGFVSVNDDDDDDDTVADYDDGYNKDGIGGNDDDACEGEDNLVPVNLSFEPGFWPHGKVEVFAFGDYKASIRVWDDPNKVGEPNLVLPNGISYLREYTPPFTVPTVLYIEGLATTPPGGVLLGIHYHNASGAEIAADAVSLTVIQVELFTDEDFTNTLDDWPREKNEYVYYPDKIRSAKYMFGKWDPIYVRVRNVGTDPLVKEDVWVKVTSESGGEAIVRLKETAENSQQFTNNWNEYGWLWPELLYLGETDSSDPAQGKRVKVENEEVLTFWLEIQPGSGNWVSCKRVMVDRAQVGVEWQNQYDVYDYAGHLNSMGFASSGFYDNFAEESNMVWFKEFNRGDLQSEESHWAACGDTLFADRVDMALWAGHGTLPAVYPKFIAFFKDEVPGVKEPLDYLYWHEIDWGNTDADWVAIHTCSLLEGSKTELMQMLPEDNGVRCVHLICGYINVTYGYEVTPGKYFAEELTKDDKSIKQAWFEQAARHRTKNAIPAVFGAYDCENDKIGSTGPIYMTRDPVRDDPDDWNRWVHSE